MIDPIAFKLGPLEIRWYALCIVTGLILAVYLSMKEAPRKRINPDLVLDFILIAFPIAIIGARLYYVIFEWSYYKDHLAEIFAIWNGGIAIYGGRYITITGNISKNNRLNHEYTYDLRVYEGAYEVTITGNILNTVEVGTSPRYIFFTGNTVLSSLEFSSSGTRVSKNNFVNGAYQE